MHIWYVEVEPDQSSEINKIYNQSLVSEKAKSYNHITSYVQKKIPTMHIHSEGQENENDKKQMIYFSRSVISNFLIALLQLEFKS